MRESSIENIRGILNEDPSVHDGAAYLLRLCEASCSSPVWEKLHSLDFDADYQTLTTWLSELLTRDPIPTSIRGLWFGIFERAMDDGSSSPCLYLSGSERYDGSMSEFEWAGDQDYLPDDYYVASGVVDAIYHAAVMENPSTLDVAQHVLILGYVCVVVSNWTRSDLCETLRGSAPFRAVAAGFDDGDGLLIDTIR